MSAHPQDQLFTAYVDGTLSAAQHEAVEAHLAACAQCRAEVHAARAANVALRALPSELDPPVDVAAAVLASAKGRSSDAGAGPQPGPGAPRWYRAASIAAAAAVIALAVFTIPRIGGEDNAPTAAEAGAAGTSSADRVTAVTQDPREFDDVSLAALAAREAAAEPKDALAGGAAPDATMSVPVNSAATSSGADAQAKVARLTSCVRGGAGDRVEGGAPLVGLISARFEGSPAVLGTFLLGPADHPTSVLVVAVAREGCAFLGSAEHGI